MAPSNGNYGGEKKLSATLVICCISTTCVLVENVAVFVLFRLDQLDSGF